MFAWEKNAETSHPVFVCLKGADPSTVYGFTVYEYFRRMTPIFHLGSCVETEAQNERV